MIKMVFLFFIIFCSQICSQKSNLKLSASIGLSRTILDDGRGINLAFNSYKKINSKFYFEAQVSNIWTKINSSFLQGNQGNIYSSNFLAGLNYYIKSKKPMVYFNFLTGLSYTNERINNSKNYEIVDLGVFTGIFLKLKKILIGFGLESPQNIVVRIGFNLK
tara:strand:+ start:897 stop:1382 length:486 start_codon:yes stop_codon:yes gene_type:complete